MNQKNKGMFLEKILNRTIRVLWENEIAFIEKKSIPISIISFNKTTDNQVISKFKHHKSTVDYIGMYKSKFICFEAKTTNLDNLPMSNFKEHQIDYLNLIHNNGGIAFVVVYFSL
ncbi:Holliday junction resolvase RecU, partial [Mycoplasma nasistruthionis]